MSRIDSAERTLAAAPERVWTALTDPDALATWMPPAGMSGRMEHFDLRPGGAYRLVLTYLDPAGAPGKSTAAADVVDVRFVALHPERRMVQAVDFVSDDPAFAGTMTMTWTLNPVDDGTRVSIRAEDVPRGIRPEEHAAGFASTLANLAAHLGLGADGDEVFMRKS